MDENLLLLSSADDGDAYLLFTANELKEKRIFLANFSLENFTDSQCKTVFRFYKADLEILKQRLRIPDKIVCRNRTVVSGIEALCILLRHLAYPNRLEDLTDIFSRPVYELSYIFNEVLNMIYENHAHLVSNFDRRWLSHANLDTFSAAISNRGAPLTHCWGFIGGTHRPICRPTINHKMLFRGHKRVHGIKFQMSSAPNGLIVNLFGPIEGCRHDSGMLRISGLMEKLQDKMTRGDGNIYSLYGDPAYPLRPQLLGPFKGAHLTDEQTIFNKRMSAVRPRISVEWTFGKFISLFPFLHFKKNNKLYLQPIGKYYIVGAILTNCHSCL